MILGLNFPTIASLLALFLSVHFLFAFSAAGPSWPKSAVKTLSVAFLALAAASGGPVLLVLALGLGACGDFFLSRPGERAFLAGMAAFALAHLAYLSLMIALPGAELAQMGILPVVALLALVLVMARLLWSRAGRLRWPVLAYVAVIASMAVAALSLPAGNLSAQVSAASFVASDTVLAAELFLLRPGSALRRYKPYVVWTLYWGAQAGFLWSFALPSAAIPH